MTDFLSADWLDEFATAVARGSCPAETALSVAQEITGGPALGWTIRIAGGKAWLEPTADPYADVRLTTDRETATAVHAGQLSAQRAFLDGRLRIGGDIHALITHRTTLEAIGVGWAVPT